MRGRIVIDWWQGGGTPPRYLSAPNATFCNHGHKSKARLCLIPGGAKTDPTPPVSSNPATIPKLHYAKPTRQADSTRWQVPPVPQLPACPTFATTKPTDSPLATSPSPAEPAQFGEPVPTIWRAGPPFWRTDGEQVGEPDPLFGEPAHPIRKAFHPSPWPPVWQGER